MKTRTIHVASLTLFAGGSSMTSVGMNASVTGDTICGLSGFCTGKIHTPTVKNYNALHGSTVVGPGVTPQTYIDTYNNVIYPRSDFTPDDYVVFVSEEVDCSTAGLFFYDGSPEPPGPPPFWEQRELGMSMWRNTKSPTGTSYSQYCSSRTSSSDIDLGFSPIAGDILDPALTVTGVAERIGGIGWQLPWLSVGEGITLAVLPSKPPDCTNWDNGWITQIKGGRILKNTGGPQPANPPVQ